MSESEGGWGWGGSEGLIYKERKRRKRETEGETRRRIEEAERGGNGCAGTARCLRLPGFTRRELLLASKGSAERRGSVPFSWTLAKIAALDRQFNNVILFWAASTLRLPTESHGFMGRQIRKRVVALRCDCCEVLEYCRALFNLSLNLGDISYCLVKRKGTPSLPGAFLRFVHMIHHTVVRG